MAQWPTTRAPAAMKLRSLYPTLVSTGQSLKRQVRTRGGQRWAVDLSYRILTRAEAAVFAAFLLTLRGQYNTCTFVMPSGSYDAPQGSWAGAPKVNGASQVGRSVVLNGFTAGATGKAGDFLKFADTKVYVLTADFTADGSGNATIAIEPALILSPNNTEAVTASQVPFTMALASDTAELSSTPPFFTDLDVTLAEAY